MVRLGVTLVAVLLFLSGTHPLVGTPRTFEDDAARAVWTWRTSGAAERWRDGFLPLGGLSSAPPEVLRKVRRDEEFGWKVAGPLPATPADGQVRWDDGTTRRVPVIGAREAMLEQSPWEDGDSGLPDEQSYHMTGATFTTMRLRTLRGMATVPAWRLRFSDLPGTIDQVAVDWDAVGRVGDLVGGMCAGVGMSGEGVAELQEPLGNRVVLNAGSGLPVLCLRMPEGC